MTEISPLRLADLSFHKQTSVPPSRPRAIELSADSNQTRLKDCYLYTCFGLLCKVRRQERRCCLIYKKLHDKAKLASLHRKRDVHASKTLLDTSS